MISGSVDTEVLRQLWDDPRVARDLDRIIGQALEEDHARTDLTSLVLMGSSNHRALARVRAEQAGVFCGGPAAAIAIHLLDATGRIPKRAEEGEAVAAGAEVLQIEASAAALLSVERTLLNLICHMSGIATRTREIVRLAGGVEVYDTRKTLPNLRVVEKLAVRAGGGKNHRFHLADFPLVKENHRDLFRKFLPPKATRTEEIFAIQERFRADPRTRKSLLEIEVEDRESFLACIKFGVDLVLIDNRKPEEFREWIEEAHQRYPEFPTLIEASGGITEANVAAYAEAGVQRVSLGALTHSVKALDMSLHVQWA